MELLNGKKISSRLQISASLLLLMLHNREANADEEGEETIENNRKEEETIPIGTDNDKQGVAEEDKKEEEVEEEDPKKLPKELEEHELYSGCAERQFTSCGSCLFNGNTWETRTTWCTTPQFCFESTDPDDHMFDPFCKGQLLTATNDESLHTVKLRCGEEHEITMYDVAMHNSSKITLGAVLLVCILGICLYLRSGALKKVKAAKFLFKDSTDYTYNAASRKKHDDLRPEALAIERTPKTMKRAAMTPGTSGGSGSGRSIVIQGLKTSPFGSPDASLLKSWTSSFDSQDSGGSEFKDDPSGLVTPFSSPMSKTFCASSDDV